MNCSTKDNLKKASVDICRLQAENNVIYSEVRHCPYLFTQQGLTVEEATVVVLDGLDEGQRRYGIKVRCILSFIRQCPGQYLPLGAYCSFLCYFTFCCFFFL